MLSPDFFDIYQSTGNLFVSGVYNFLQTACIISGFKLMIKSCLNYFRVKFSNVIIFDMCPKFKWETVYFCTFKKLTGSLLPPNTSGDQGPNQGFITSVVGNTHGNQIKNYQFLFFQLSHPPSSNWAFSTKYCPFSLHHGRVAPKDFAS